MLSAVRKLLLIALVVLAWPASALAESATLTIKAPASTAFGRKIYFAGRLIPATAGATIRLYNGSRLVKRTALRGDGTYVIRLRVGSPGPFHVAWRDVNSAPLTVRLQPLLQTSLIGQRIVGSKLVLRAALQPEGAGILRISVVRAGKPDSSTVYYHPATVPISTRELGGFQIKVLSVPRPGYLTLSKTLAVDLVPPRLAYGSTSPVVAQLTRQLAAMHYAIPYVSSTFGSSLIDTVYAFQKEQRLDRTGAVDPVFWSKLQQPFVPHARYAQPAAHIEVDKTKQVLYLVRNGQITLIAPVSTAGLPGRFTPEGQFSIYRKVTGWDTSPLGLLYDPMYFTGGYAIHGNPSVPPYPASHGCIRVPMWLIPRLFVSEPYGETVYVYSS